jgi:hypothetical protein
MGGEREKGGRGMGILSSDCRVETRRNEGMRGH